MDVATMYSLRAMPKVSLSPACMEAIARMRCTPVSYRPTAHAHGKRGYHRRTPTAPVIPDNWRIKALVDTHRRVKEREDPDYDVVVESVNKLSKEFFDQFVKDVLEVLSRRDHVFRLRVTTLLFDRGIVQNFFAPIIAKFIKTLTEKTPEMRDDIAAQIEMFDTLYDAGNVIIVPSSRDPGYDDAIISWTKQKEKKRGFAVLVGELFSNGMVNPNTMESILKGVASDLDNSSQQATTDATVEHVDHLARFLFAVAPNIKGNKSLIMQINDVLGRERSVTTSLGMKSRFKLEDALKILKSASA